MIQDEQMVNATVGFPEEIPKFLARNPGFARLYPELLLWSHNLFGTEEKYSLDPSGIVSFGLLASAQETFLEIVCLAGNGFGSAAQARLRTMFEYVSLAAYFLVDPTQAEKFIYFQRIEGRKELSHAVELYRHDANPEFISRLSERMKQVSHDISNLEQRYGKQFRRSWHGGFDRIAQKLKWEQHYFYCYLVPNRHVHASPRRLETRVTREDQLYFEGAPDYDSADEAVRGGSTMLILSFGVMNDLLSLGRREALQKLSSELIDAYKDVPNRTRV